MKLIQFLLENPDCANGLTISMKATELIQLMNYMIDKTKQEPSLPKQNPDHLLDIDEVAEILRVSRVTLWQWGKKKLLMPIKVGHLVRYRRSDVDEFISSKTN